MAEPAIAATLESSPPSMGKFALFARLGDGGMADVFLAVARGPGGFNKLAVIKRLRNGGDNENVRMFLEEARLSARLSHPNIVQTHEVGEAERRFFIVMEYLDGQSLQALLDWLGSRGEGVSDPVAAFIAEQVLRGLHYAHELVDYDGTPLGVVHRDVSPHNIFITYRGEVKLLDFGIAKTAANKTHTETGVLKGKIRYMAPEQIAERSVDRRVDVFALGIVLWEIVARRKLYDDADTLSVLNRIGRDDAPSVRTVRPEISPELDAIIARALRRDPDERYATADEMRVDLERFVRSKMDAETDTALARILEEAFASTRAHVRARIKAFLAMVPNTEPGTPSASRIGVEADQFPILSGEGSGPKAATVAPGPDGTADAATASRPAAAGARWLVLGVGAFVVALIALTSAMLGSRSASRSASRPEGPAGSAHVRVDTTPPGARVEWNGTSLGMTPSSFTLAPGAQTLTLSREGYEVETITLDVAPGASIDRALALRPKTPAAPSAGTRPPEAPPAPAPPPSFRAAPPLRSKPVASAAPSASALPHPKIHALDDRDLQ
jgi:serine/threonine protein kinase